MVNVETVVVEKQRILQNKKLITGFGKNYVNLVIMFWKKEFYNYSGNLMSSVSVRCAYCGQMTKLDHCGCYRGMDIHNIPTCNCLEEARKIKSLEEFDRKKWFISSNKRIR